MEGVQREGDQSSVGMVVQKKKNDRKRGIF